MLTGITGTRVRERDQRMRGAAGGTGFALPAGGQSAAAASATAASGSAALLPLLALQAEDDETARNRRTQDRGEAMLEELSALQSALLAGRADPDRIAHLAALASAPNEGVDPQLAEIVDLKFFCGFSFAEIAAMRGVSERTVQRQWDKARIYLHRSVSADALR